MSASAPDPPVPPALPPVRRLPRADGDSLLRSRKRNFSEAEVSALLRCVSARRKKLMASPQDKVPRWQRTQIWKQVTEAVNSASGFRNRRTPAEVKKKWSDIKIEAKKRLRVATERGDCAELRTTDKLILDILDRDCPQDCPQTCCRELGATDRLILDILDRDCPQDGPQTCPTELRATDRLLLDILDRDCPQDCPRDQDCPQTCPKSSPLDQDQDCPPEAPWVKQEPDLMPTIVHVATVKSEPLPSDSDPTSTSTEHAQSGTFPQNHVTEHAQSGTFPQNHVTEHAQSARPDVMLLLLQNQQQILDTLRSMAQTFSQINSSLKDISHTLKNR